MKKNGTLDELAHYQRATRDERQRERSRSEHSKKHRGKEGRSHEGAECRSRSCATWPSELPSLSKIWSWAPKESLPSRDTGRLTVGANSTSILRRGDHKQGLEDLSVCSGASMVELLKSCRS
jgi:hypothetical protein